MNTLENDDTSRALPALLAQSKSARPGSPQLQIKTLLVPLDFSRASIEALKYAIQIAVEFGAGIHLLHVQSEEEFASVPQAASLLLDCRDVMEMMQNRLGSAHPSNEDLFHLDRCHVRCGKPFREICALATEIAADLIVLPTRGHSGLRHMILGSTAERVVRYAPCPVLVARGKEFHRSVLDCEAADFAISSILVPIDFSECSLAGLDYAGSLARACNAKLCLFHALFPYDGLIIADRMSGSALPPIEETKASALQELKQLTERPAVQGLSCEARIAVGYPVDQIVAETSGGEFDLVVSATHGRTGFKHAVIGSVAEHIVRYSDCAVVIVPTRGA